ncbi:MAG: hypothetical protein AAB388_04845 [Patescibacteria group bacterium]
MAITVGKAFLEIDTRARLTSVGGQYSAYMQLQFLKGDVPVRLWKGGYPRVDISKLAFDPIMLRNELGSNIITNLSAVIADHVEDLLRQHPISVTQGQRYYDRDYFDGDGLYKLNWSGIEAFPGLSIDKTAVAHKKWFED